MLSLPYTKIHAAGIDWPTWLTDPLGTQSAQDQAQQAINDAAQEVAQQAKARQEKATADVQQTIQQQATSQGAQARAALAPTAANVSAAAQQASATAQTWQTVGYVVAGVAILGLGYYVYHTSVTK